MTTVCTAVAGLLVLAAGVLLLVWVVRRRGADGLSASLSGSSSSSAASRRRRHGADPEKSNNLHSEENLRRQQLAPFKTLNVMELTRTAAAAPPPPPPPPPLPSLSGVKAGDVEATCAAGDGAYANAVAVDCDAGACSSCAPSLESSPIYKAPMPTDARNHAAAAAHLAAKQVNVKLFQPIVKGKEVVV